MDEGAGTAAADVQTVVTQTNGTLTNGPTWAALPNVEEFKDNHTLALDGVHWDTYCAGTGYQSCPVNVDGLGATICEIGVTDASSSAAYSDGNIRELSYAHDGNDHYVGRLRVVGLGKGTKGWGFWNGGVGSSEAIWFWWGSDDLASNLRGFRALVIDGGSITYNLALASVDIEAYHTYEVIRYGTIASFIIDGATVGYYDGTVPDSAMRVETWVDNRVWPDETYLDLDINQLIYIDWQKFTRQLSAPLAGAVSIVVSDTLATSEALD
jgi:hypothetical protein